MKNKHTGILSLGIGIGIVLGSTMFSNAAATFQSSGKIKYTDQTTGNTVVFDSEDFNTIENNITTGKNDILQSLQDIKTYLDADGNVVQYEQPDTSYTGTPGFDKLAEAVSKSQEVPTLEDRTVTDKEGNKLYYKSEDAKNSRNIMESTTTDPGFVDAEIKGYTSATADNLSAGTAAWVNGELILGNGFDNTAYFEQGKDGTFTFVADINQNTATYEFTESMDIVCLSNGKLENVLQLNGEPVPGYAANEVIGNNHVWVLRSDILSVKAGDILSKTSSERGVIIMRVR